MAGISTLLWLGTSSQVVMISTIQEDNLPPTTVLALTFLYNPDMTGVLKLLHDEYLHMLE